MRVWCLLILTMSILIADDESRTYVSQVTNESDIAWEVSRRCDTVTKGEGAVQVYYAGSAGAWQPMLTVLRHSRGILADPFGVKGVMLKDPYLTGCQLKLRPLCVTDEKKYPTYYIRHGIKVSGFCPSARSFGPYLIDVSIGKDFEEEDTENKVRACAADMKVVRYCGDEEAFINLLIRQDGSLDFQQGPNCTLLDLKEKSPFIIRRLSDKERAHERATWSAEQSARGG